MYKQTLKAIMTLFLAGSATIGSAANDTMPLHSGWKFRQANRNEWHPATVPGVVHTDLMDNGLIEDPYYRLNERSLQWIDKEDWIYEVSFDAGALTRGYEHVRLEFLGLDTYADVFLNETQILTADNMFRRWAAEVKPLLKERGNVLRVYFHSPINKALPQYESLPYRYEAWNDQADNGGLDGKKLSPFTRKAGYHYGWDWGPRLVTSGIWRPVKLQGWNELRLEDVFHRQTEVSSEAARVETQVEIEAAAPVENTSILSVPPWSLAAVCWPATAHRSGSAPSPSKRSPTPTDAACGSCSTANPFSARAPTTSPATASCPASPARPTNARSGTRSTST